MREWSEWAQSLTGLGFSDSTTLWRAVMGTHGGEFASRPPAGLRALEIHGALRRLVSAMDTLAEDDDARPHLACLQATYLLGPEQAMALCTKSRTKLYEGCRTAETLLLVEMKRH